MKQKQRVESIKAAVVTDHPDINCNLVKRIKLRVGRCYEISGQLVLDNPAWGLIHTSIFTGTDRIGHAYLLQDGVIYDPVNDLFYNEEKLNKILLPENTRVYTSIQAAKLMSKYGHWGTWDEESGPKTEKEQEDDPRLYRRTIDERVRLLVSVLAMLPEITPFESCGGHKKPGLRLNPEPWGHFRVEFATFLNVPDERIRPSISIIQNVTFEYGGKVILIKDDFPPTNNTRVFVFTIQYQPVFFGPLINF
jgi:hypothetical protein